MIPGEALATAAMNLAQAAIDFQAKLFEALPPDQKAAAAMQHFEVVSNWNRFLLLFKIPQG